MVYNGKPYKNGWFGGTTIFGNTHIYTHILHPEWLTCPMYPQLQSLTPWRSSGHLKILCGFLQIVWYSCIRKPWQWFFSHSGFLYLRGIIYLLYHPKAPTLFSITPKKSPFYNIRKTSSFHLNHAGLFLLRICLLDIITFCAVTLGEYRSTLRYKLLDLHLNKPMISPWNKNTPILKFIDLETAQMSSLIQFASWKQQNFHVTACLLRFKSVLPLRNKGLTRNYINIYERTLSVFFLVDLSNRTYPPGPAPGTKILIFRD